MQTILWEGMILIGIIYSALTNNFSNISDAALNSSKEAVSLCITMVGVMAFWCGLMEIATQAGIIEAMSKKMRPVIKFLFPRLDANHPAAKHITTNIIANVLGLGWAATPAGLLAMEELANLEEERRGKEQTLSAGEKKAAMPKGVASNEMCNFLIINISSLQLIPVTVIAYRSQYGSVHPTSIVGAGIIATTISTLAGVVFCKIMERK